MLRRALRLYLHLSLRVARHVLEALQDDAGAVGSRCQVWCAGGGRARGGVRRGSAVLPAVI